MILKRAEVDVIGRHLRGTKYLGGQQICDLAARVSCSPRAAACKRASVSGYRRASLKLIKKKTEKGRYRKMVALREVQRRES